MRMFFGQDIADYEEKNYKIRQPTLRHETKFCEMHEISYINTKYSEEFEREKKNKHTAS